MFIVFDLRLCMLILLSLLTGLLSSGIATAADLPDLKGYTITIATENAYPPLQYINSETGEAEGFEYDVIKELSKRLNFKIKYANIQKLKLINSVSSGQYDMGMSGINIRSWRQRKVKFSNSYLFSNLAMMVRNDEARFHDIESFRANKKCGICLVRNSNYFFVGIHQILETSILDPRLSLRKTLVDCVKDLFDGKTDLVLAEKVISEEIAEVNYGYFKTIGKPLGHENYGFIFPKHSKLVSAINAGLETMKEDGTLDRLYEDWIADLN